MNMICKSVADNECGCTLYSGVHVCTRGGQMYRGHTSGSGSALTSAHNSEPESETDRETVRAGLISATGVLSETVRDDGILTLIMIPSAVKPLKTNIISQQKPGLD